MQSPHTSLGCATWFASESLADTSTVRIPITAIKNRARALQKTWKILEVGLQSWLQHAVHDATCVRWLQHAGHCWSSNQARPPPEASRKRKMEMYQGFVEAALITVIWTLFYPISVQSNDSWQWYARTIDSLISGSGELEAEFQIGEHPLGLVACHSAFADMDSFAASVADRSVLPRSIGQWLYPWYPVFFQAPLFRYWHRFEIWVWVKTDTTRLPYSEHPFTRFY